MQHYTNPERGPSPAGSPEVQTTKEQQQAPGKGPACWPCLSCGQLGRGQGWEAAVITKWAEARVHLSTLAEHQTAPHQDLSPSPQAQGLQYAPSQTRALVTHAAGQPARCGLF